MSQVSSHSRNQMPFSNFLSTPRTLDTSKEITMVNRLNSCSLKKEEVVGDGISLTWQDLWVTVQNGSFPILQALTGYAQPGQILAIMGPSGSGKSTLLEALAGRLESNTRQSGQIHVNGRKQKLASGAYVTQDDTLMSTLTVKEAVYYSALLQLPDSMSRSEKRERADTTIKEMGLKGAMNTRIGGGWRCKGISGGQMRRVSICIQILKRPKLLFLDEPTSGLDSAASYHVMKRIMGLARQDGRTVIASIHQPSTEVFQLFDNLCLLSSGKTVYFGPAAAAYEFFSLNGFPCPTLMNPSDHYLRTVNTDFDQDVEQGHGNSITTDEVIKTLVTSYKCSWIRQEVDQRITELHKNETGLSEMGVQASFITQCLVLTRRSFVNMNRDIGYYWMRLFVYVVLCLCVGSIFYDIGHSYGSILARGSMLMFAATLLTFMAIGSFPSFVEDMKIFGRERLNGHYRVAAFVVGNTISSIPYLLLNSIVPGAIAYFLVGLQKGGSEHFIYFSLVVFACTMLVESVMMIVAAIVPNFLMGIVTGAGIQGVMLLNAGFFRLPNDLPNPIWKYPMYYIAFHKYAIEGLYKNEYEGLSFPSNPIESGQAMTGDEVLRVIWQVQMGYSKWVDLLILFGMVVLYRLIFFGILKITEIMKPIIRSLVLNPTKQKNTITVEPPSTPMHLRGTV